jgi:medium-chain acyl-[acyl-carrier-protein] hydrolase
MIDKNKKQQIWVDEYRIHSFEIDVKGNATLQILCKYMQESAWHHAENLGVGFSHLIKKNLVWVLSNQIIKIDSFPKWDEIISIHTWRSGKGRLSYFRDFKILNDKNQVISSATTKWYAIDLTTRRPQNLEDYFDFQISDSEQVVSYKVVKIEPVTSGNNMKTFEVGYSDLDVNEHVNNVKYIEWILEYFPLEFRKSYILRSLEINYLNEARYGDELSILSENDEQNIYLHGLFRSSDEAELCRARTIWDKYK